VVNKIVSEFMKLQGGRSSEGHPRHRCSLATRAALVLPVATMSLAAGCGNTNAHQLFRLLRWKSLQHSRE